MREIRKPGGGRKPSKPEYSAEWNLTQQAEAATALYKENYSLQSIADALSLNPIKVRKLLITAGIYESDVAKMVQRTFYNYRDTELQGCSSLHRISPQVVQSLRHLVPAIRKGRVLSK